MRFLRYLFAVALLPLSILPFGAFLVAFHKPPAHAPYLSSSVRAGGELPWAAPNVTLSASALRLKPPPTYNSGIPVLLFHGINNDENPATDTYSQTPKSFALELALLRHLGYHTISIYQYVAWREGKKVHLPSRPLLITFDDGRFDTYRGADQILARYHMQATIFVIVGQAQGHDPFYLSWQELRRMQNSGRWNIQFHAYMGHVQVQNDAAGDTASFYGSREWWQPRRLPDGEVIPGHLETAAQYRARVNHDLSTGLAILAAHGWRSDTMAMPFGEYGQSNESNQSDPVGAANLPKILAHYFRAVFIQSGHSFTPYSSPTSATPTGAAIRLELRHNSTLGDLYGFLRRGNPTIIEQIKRSCPGFAEYTVYQGETCQR